MSSLIRLGTVLPNVGHQAAQLIRQRAAMGFESFQLAYKNTLSGIDLLRLADEVTTACQETHTVISCVGIYGNALVDSVDGAAFRDELSMLIEHTQAFGTDIVGCFTGRVPGQSIPASIPRFKEIFSPLAELAESKNLRIAFENCLQGGTWQFGDRNMAHNPAAWELLFEAIPGAHLGLQWEPAHQLCQLIDPLPQLRQWAPRIFHLHGKDAEVRADIIARQGVYGPEWFAWHRFPGLGASNWALLISELVASGFVGSIDIEGGHDPVYRGDLDLAGQQLALAHLQSCRPALLGPKA